MSALVTLGETMALLAATTPGRIRDKHELALSVGGSESNVAIGVRRLDVEATWIGRVGADEFGELILATLRAEGVDTSAAVIDRYAPTGLMFKEQRFGVSRVTYYRSGYAGSRLCRSDVSRRLIESATILHVTGITPALSPSAREAVESAVQIARAARVLVSFDFNYRTALWGPVEAAVCLESLARQADLVFASEDELELLGDEPLAVARALVGDGERTVIVKRGRRGVIALDSEGRVEEPSLTVQVVDPIGAGDAFVAGYLAGVVKQLDRRARLRLGCAAAACVVASVGDWQGLPGWDDLALVGGESGMTLR